MMISTCFYNDSYNLRHLKFSKHQRVDKTKDTIPINQLEFKTNIV